MSVHSPHPHRDVRGGWEGTHCKALGASASLGQKGSGLNWAKHAETRCRQSESTVSSASLLSPPLIRTTPAGEIPTRLRQTKAPPRTVAPAGGQTRGQHTAALLSPRWYRYLLINPRWNPQIQAQLSFIFCQ